MVPSDPTDAPVADVVTLRPRPDPPRWAEPGRCPRCGEVGDIDVIDLVVGVLHQRCDACRTDWRIRR